MVPVQCDRSRDGGRCRSATSPGLPPEHRDPERGASPPRRRAGRSTSRATRCAHPAGAAPERGTLATLTPASHRDRRLVDGHPGARAQRPLPRVRAAGEAAPPLPSGAVRRLRLMAAALAYRAVLERQLAWWRQRLGVDPAPLVCRPTGRARATAPGRLVAALRAGARARRAAQPLQPRALGGRSS